MIVLIVVFVLLLLCCGLLWASGGQTVYAASGSGIIEAIPGALQEEPTPPAGTLVILACRLTYGVGSCGTSPRSAAATCDALDQVIETIIESGADVVLLQEVDFAGRRAHEIDQLYYIAAALGWGYVARAVTWECRYLPWPLGHPTGRVRSGIGVMSRYPLIQNVRQRLPQARALPSFLARLLPGQVVQMVDVQCGTPPLRVLNAYLVAPGTATYQRQARALVAFVREVCTPTSVLLGAFPGVAIHLSLEQTLAGLSAEFDGRLQAVPEQGDAAAMPFPQQCLIHAWVGSGLQPLEARPVAPREPCMAHLPLMLRLRWALPVLAMHGQNHVPLSPRG